MNPENENLGFAQSVLDEFNVEMAPAPPAPTQEEEEYLSVKVGDSVIEGKSYQEIAEKLAEQNQQLAAKRVQDSRNDDIGYYDPAFDETRTPLTAEELFVLGQSFPTDPVGTTSQLMEEIIGFDPRELRDLKSSVDGMKTEIAGHKAGTAFRNAHKDDYYPSEYNAALMEEYILSHGLNVTRGSLEEAFTDLKGRLQPPPQKPAREKRENLTVTSGISDRMDSTFEEPTVPSADKFASMTAAQMESWIKAQEAKLRG